MKYLKTYPEKCTQCHSCEETCAFTFFKEKNFVKSCIKITDEIGSVQIGVCNQCGKCIEMCQPQAISINPQGVVVINKKLCIGCLICVAECPCKVMRYYPEHKTPFKCIACGACVGKCPTGALELVKE
jgi:ferredoxin